MHINGRASSALCIIHIMTSNAAYMLLINQFGMGFEISWAHDLNRIKQDQKFDSLYN